MEIRAKNGESIDKGSIEGRTARKEGGRGAKANNRGGSRPVINAPLNDKPSRLQM